MKQALIDDILNEPISYTTSKWVIERIPYIFNNDLDLYIDWKERLSTIIGVDCKAIVFTGSSSVGFSLNPTKNLKQFHSQSDVDVAIVSNYFFDISWYHLRNLGPRYHRLKPDEKIAVNDHVERLIYHGTIATDKIIHILPFGSKWVGAMSQMMKIAPTQNRDINFRIYKDFEALKSYQTLGITKLKDKLLKP